MSDILIIDSSTNLVSVAAGSSNLDSVSKSIEQPSSHSENILSCVEYVLKERSSSMSDISAIGVGVGPGLFTGLRVGISAAHAFSHALGIPLVYFSSLELSAMSSFSATSKGVDEILIAKDARRNELYFAKYEVLRRAPLELRIDESKVATCMKRIEDEQLISPQGFVEIVNTSDSCLVALDDNSKYPEFRDIDPKRFEKIIPAKVDSKFAIDLVVDSVMSGITANVFAPKALYIRKSDAELSWGITS